VYVIKQVARDADIEALACVHSRRRWRRRWWWFCQDSR